VALSNPRSSLVGSGMIINALTGMISENIKISSFTDWGKLQTMMNDDHYTKKDILINCFSLNGNKKSPSNYIKNKQEMKDIITLENSTFKKKNNRRNSAVEFAMNNLDDHDLQDSKI